MKKGHAVVDQSIAKSVIVGVCASCVAAATAMGIITILILREILTIPNLSFCIPGLHFIAIFAGSLSAGIISKEKMLLTNGVIVGVVYFLCVGMTILVFDGQFSGIVADFALGLLGALCAVLIHARRTGNRHRQFRKRKIC